MPTVTQNPKDRDNDIIGQTFTVKECQAREHDNGVGCICLLIGKKVTIKKAYNTPFAGTATYWIKGSRKRVRLSELGLPDRMAQ